MPEWSWLSAHCSIVTWWENGGWVWPRINLCCTCWEWSIFNTWQCWDSNPNNTNTEWQVNQRLSTVQSPKGVSWMPQSASQLHLKGYMDKNVPRPMLFIALRLNSSLCEVPKFRPGKYWAGAWFSVSFSGSGLWAQAWARSSSNKQSHRQLNSCRKVKQLPSFVTRFHFRWLLFLLFF